MWASDKQNVQVLDVRSIREGSPMQRPKVELLAKIKAEKERISSAMRVLRTVPLFSELSDEQLKQLAYSLTRTHITLDEKTGEWSYSSSAGLSRKQKGGVVIAQGDEGDTMFVVEAGRLQAEVDVVRSVENPEGVVKQYSKGDFFGELALVTSDFRGATVRCVEDCVLLSLDKATVLDLLPGQLDALVEVHRRRTAINVLQKVPLFSPLSQSQLDEVVGKLRRIELKTEDDGRIGDNDEFPEGLIIREGDEGSAMYVVESGRLQAEVEMVKSNDNPNGVVKEYGALEFFGELALVADEKGGKTVRSASIRCTDDSVLLELKREDLPASIFGGKGLEEIQARRSSYHVTRTMLTYGGPEKYCCGAPGIVIHPKTRFVTYKDILITCLILYSCTWEPFKAAFVEGDELNNFTDYIVDSIYWIDIAINLITGYQIQNTIVLDAREVAMHYVRTWFIVDVAATFPWDRVAAWTTNTDTSGTPGDPTSSAAVQNLTLLRLLRLIRILRIIRMGRIVERLSNHFKIRSAMIKILQLVVGLMIVVHLVACLFYMLSYLSAKDAETCLTIDGIKTCVLMTNDEASLKEHELATSKGLAFTQPTECMDFANDTHEARGTMLSTWVCANGAGRDQGRTPGQAYLLATYFSITTVSTIGYGDISPELDNDTELLFTVTVEFFGMFVFSYTVSNMASMVANLNVKNKEFHERTDRYMEWMRDKETPDGLRDRVLAYLNLVEASEFKKTEKDVELMSQLSVPLQVEMRQMIFHKRLKEVFAEMKIFQGPEQLRDEHRYFPVYGTHWAPNLPSQKLLSEFTEDIAVCIKSLIVMQNDLIVHRGEPSSNEMFILLKGEVKLLGNDRNRTRRITADSPYPFFGLAEILAKREADQYEHRSVVAMEDCELGRISRNDFEAMIHKFPAVHTDLKAVAKAALDDALSMDRPVTKKQLQRAFTDVCNNNGVAGDGLRISKIQLVELLECDALDCELAEPMLTRAIDFMDPIGALEENIAPSTPRVDFGNFYVWWTKSNFADPKGFLDSLMPMLAEDDIDPMTGDGFALRDEFDEPVWVGRPPAWRVSLHYSEDEVQRGEGAEGVTSTRSSHYQTENMILDNTSPNAAPTVSTLPNRTQGTATNLERRDSKEPVEAAAGDPKTIEQGDEPVEVQKRRMRRRSLDAGLGGDMNLMELTEEADSSAPNAATSSDAADSMAEVANVKREVQEVKGNVLAVAKTVAGVEGAIVGLERHLQETDKRLSEITALLVKTLAKDQTSQGGAVPKLSEADPPD